jgi:hypothetical protein
MMIVNHEPILHEIHSVSETAEAGVYVAIVDLSDINGERYVDQYVSRPDDGFGLAPTVRDAIAAWIADGKPVSAHVS